MPYFLAMNRYGSSLAPPPYHLSTQSREQRKHMKRFTVTKNKILILCWEFVWHICYTYVTCVARGGSASWILQIIFNNQHEKKKSYCTNNFKTGLKPCLSPISGMHYGSFKKYVGSERGRGRRWYPKSLWKRTRRGWRLRQGVRTL